MAYYFISTQDLTVGSVLFFSTLLWLKVCLYLSIKLQNRHDFLYKNYVMRPSSVDLHWKTNLYSTKHILLLLKHLELISKWLHLLCFKFLFQTWPCLFHSCPKFHFLFLLCLSMDQQSFICLLMCLMV